LSLPGSFVLPQNVEKIAHRASMRKAIQAKKMPGCIILNVFVPRRKIWQEILDK